MTSSFRSQLVDSFELLVEEDREKIAYFLELLLEKEKYERTRQEIEQRRREISEGEVLTHDEVWSHLDV